MTSEIEICIADATNFSEISRLFKKLHDYNASLDSRFSLHESWKLHLRARLYNTRNLWLLARDNSECVGLLSASVHVGPRIFRNTFAVEIQDLYVVSSHRRKGVARKLLSRAYDWAKGREMESVLLYLTLSNTTARTLYLSEGFEECQLVMYKQLET